MNNCRLKDKVLKLGKLSVNLQTKNFHPYLHPYPGKNKEERLKTWYDHFKSLLGPEQPDIDISDDYFNRKISNYLPIDTGKFQFIMKVLDKYLSKHTKNNPNLL